jgi:hypothetical protein
MISAGDETVVLEASYDWGSVERTTITAAASDFGRLQILQSGLPSELRRLNDSSLPSM